MIEHLRATLCGVRLVSCTVYSKTIALTDPVSKTIVACFANCPAIFYGKFLLRAIGFEVKLKPFINRSDGSSKGDWDVGITIDIMEYASKSDIIVLASGDGDFDILISRIRKMYNNETEVYGVSNLTANS